MPGVKTKLLAARIPTNVLVFSETDDDQYKAIAAETKGLYRRIADTPPGVSTASDPHAIKAEPK